MLYRKRQIIHSSCFVVKFLFSIYICGGFYGVKNYLQKRSPSYIMFNLPYLSEYILVIIFRAMKNHNVEQMYSKLRQIVHSIRETKTFPNPYYVFEFLLLYSTFLGKNIFLISNLLNAVRCLDLSHKVWTNHDWIHDIFKVRGLFFK